MNLRNKNIILAISAGIAAYKSAHLIRLLTAAGAQVQVVMTRNACEFITPTTLQALSRNPVRIELFDPAAEAAMGHIELARWADLIILAPATASSMARIAHGFADDLVSTLWLAADCHKVVAPAMNQQMWKASSTQENIHKLQQQQIHIIGPEPGGQACGDVGPGRMSEPEQIVAAITKIITPEDPNQLEPIGVLSGLNLMVTAGPTVEEIDPVRFISNRSSGKMGYAVAEAAKAAGAKVILVSGPTQLPAPEVDFYAIKSAQQMYDTVMQKVSGVDIFIACAAVADYRPETIQNEKIKKQKGVDSLQLNLIKNPDIVKSVAALDSAPFTVGFAAETHDLVNNAHSKLKNKKLQLIVANKVGTHLAFDQDDNELHLFWPEGEEKFKKSSKKHLAIQLIEKIASLYQLKK